MKCAICKKEVLDRVIYQMPTGIGDTPFACSSCMMSSDYYCKIHNQVHIGFGDKTTACRECIYVEARINNGRLPDFYSQVYPQLTPQVAEDLKELIEPQNAISGWPTSFGFMWRLTLHSLREKRPVEAIAGEMIDKKSIAPLLK